MEKEGGKVETLTDFLFLGSKITVEGDCSYEIKRHLLLGRTAMIYLDSVFKSRDLTLQTKVHMVKAMIFPVVMYGCEHWTTKKSECWRTDAFKLLCCRRFLRVPWTARKSNQWILKEIIPEYSWKNWCCKTVVLEKIIESPLDSKEIKPINPKGNQHKFSLEGLMMKLKLQYFGHLM